MTSGPSIAARNLRFEDVDQIIEVSRLVHPGSRPWRREQLESHLERFPEGQFVAEDASTGNILGLASSLIIRWDTYRIEDDWRTFTDCGMFTNHDPEGGRTLYAAEVMVRPDAQRRGVGSALYAARRELMARLGLRRIRGAGRLRGFHQVADRMGAVEYVQGVVRGTLHDPTLSFQLRHGFEVIAVVSNYLPHDPESQGWAAVFELLNPDFIGEPAPADRDMRFTRPPPPEGGAGWRGIRHTEPSVCSLLRHEGPAPRGAGPSNSVAGRNYR